MSTAVVDYPPPPAEFSVTRKDVPVWGEHIAPIGKGVPIGKAALERIVAASNDRIADMGSYAPQIILHSPKKKEPGDVTPPVVRKVVGCMGPYRVKQIGRLKPRWAITADLHYSKDFEGSIKDYPERSVEYVWKDDLDPTDGRLDALALLPVGTSGALDLGLQYESSDTRRLRYSAEDIEAMTKEDCPAMDETQTAALIEQLKPIIAQMIAAAMSGAAPAPAAPPVAAPVAGGAAQYEMPLEHRLKYEAALTKIKELEERETAMKTETEKRLALLEGEHKKTVRYSALERLRSDGYVIGDISKEFDHYLQYSDEMFDKAIEHRRQFTPRVPQSALPIPGSKTLSTIDESQSVEKRMQYSNEATRRVKAAERDGKVLDYSNVLREVIAEAKA